MGEFGLVDLWSGWAGAEWLRPDSPQSVASRGSKAFGKDSADATRLTKRNRE